MKKFLIVIMFMLSLFFATACKSEFENAEISDFEYISSPSSIILTKYTGTKETLKIKSKYDGLYVVLSSDAFRGNTTIKKVILPGCSNIPDYSFENCVNLEYVKFVGGNQTIGEYAFSGCSNLKTADFSTSIYEIEPTAFINCSKLSELIGHAGGYVKDFEKSIIYSTGTSTVLVGGANAIIKDTIVGIAPYAFYGRSDLQSITIPASVTTIGENAFGNCDGLKQIKVDSLNTVFDSRENCNAIIESVTDKLLVGCSNTIIPRGIKTIASYAFEDCDSLTGITIPATVKTIEKNAFLNCKNIASINVSPDNSIYDCRDNSNALIDTLNNKLILACDNSVIPSSITTISENAYSSTNNLNKITLPEGVTTIEDRAFYNLDNLKTLEIPSTVTQIGKEVIYDCDNLENIKISSGNTKFDSRENCNAIIETETNKLLYGCKNTVIPSTVTVIGERAFEGCLGLTELRFPDTLVVIEDYAFLDCTNVNLIKLSDSITTIGIGAFKGLEKVETITIPKSVTSIGQFAFADCKLWKITVDANNSVYDSRGNCDAIIETATNALILGCVSTIIPDSVTIIKSNAFYGAENKIINISANITKIEIGAFSHASKIEQYTVDANNPVYDLRNNAIVETATNTLIAGCDGYINDETITSIAEYAFAGNENVLYVAVLKTLTTIGAHAFEDCSNLLNANLPKTVTYVGENAFNGCTMSSYSFNVWSDKYTLNWHENWNGSKK